VIGRRAFLQTAAAGAACLAGRAQSADSRIEILPAEPIGGIAPAIYSHFVEHLGGVVYDGIWVGENSRLPNVGGLRNALIDALVRTKPGAIRWPGGCYADQYDWRDGIGPRAQRPRRTNFWVDSPEWPKNTRLTLAADDVHAHNTFETPRAVEPKEQSVSVRGGTLAHRFPPASVTKLELTRA
jgi:alpha-L-arabinofuranosidase